MVNLENIHICRLLNLLKISLNDGERSAFSLFLFLVLVHPRLKSEHEMVLLAVRISGSFIILGKRGDRTRKDSRLSIRPESLHVLDNPFPFHEGPYKMRVRACTSVHLYGISLVNSCKAVEID